MVYTTRQLITDSYYLSNVVARDFEEISGSQLLDGLKRLNAILGITASQIGLIPYYRKYNFTGIVGQGSYYVPGLATMESLTYYIGPVRYPMERQTRQQFWAYSKIDNINSLPAYWDMERRNDGADVYVYFNPADEYLFELWGKFQLSSVTLDQNLSEDNQEFYLEYLRYKLAHYIAQLNGSLFDPDKKTTLDSYEQSVRNVAPIDFTLRKLSAFQPLGTPDYAQQSLSHGWTVL